MPYQRCQRFDSRSNHKVPKQPPVCLVGVCYHFHQQFNYMYITFNILIYSRISNTIVLLSDEIWRVS